MVRERNLIVRMSEEEAEKTKNVAEQDGKTVSEWIRGAVEMATEMGIFRVSQQFKSTGHWKAVRAKKLHPDAIRAWGKHLGFDYTDQDVAEILSNQIYQTKLRQAFALYADLKLYYISTRNIPVESYPVSSKEPKGKKRKGKEG